jgi:hypothetical protein
MANAPHDHVHRLIRSMSRAEKRYFKLYTSRHLVGGHSNHQTLFDAIAAMESYDEAALLQRFEGEAFTRRFPITKRRLYEAILASLDAFHADGSVDARLRRMLHQAELLHQRALYADAARMLRSVRQLARQHDRQTVLLDVLERERRLLERANYAGTDAATVERLAEEGRTLRQELEQVEALWSLKSRCMLLLYRSGHVRGEAEQRAMQAMLTHPLLTPGASLLTAKARFLHHHVLSALAFAQGDLAGCAGHLAANHALLRAEEPCFQDEPNLLFSVLSNRIYVLSRLGRTDETEALLREFRMLPATLPQAPSADLEVKVFATGASLELAMLARQGDFTKGVERTAAIEERMAHHDARLGPLRKAGLLFQLAYVHLGAGLPDKALRYSHRQLSEGPVDADTEVHRFGRLLNLLILLDLGRRELLPTALRSTMRMLGGHGQDRPLERALLTLVNELLKARTPASERVACDQAMATLLALEHDPREQAVHDHFDPLAWVEARRTGRPLAEVVRQRAQAASPLGGGKGRRAA